MDVHQLSRAPQLLQSHSFPTGGGADGTRGAAMCGAGMTPARGEAEAGLRAGRERDRSVAAGADFSFFSFLGLPSLGKARAALGSLGSFLTLDSRRGLRGESRSLRLRGGAAASAEAGRSGSGPGPEGERRSTSGEVRLRRLCLGDGDERRAEVARGCLAEARAEAPTAVLEPEPKLGLRDGSRPGGRPRPSLSVARAPSPRRARVARRTKGADGRQSHRLVPKCCA